MLLIRHGHPDYTTDTLTEVKSGEVGTLTAPRLTLFNDARHIRGL